MKTQPIEFPTQTEVTPQSAIVTVEFQKTWTGHGLLARLVRDQRESRGVVENARRLVANARRRSIPIIHAPLVVDPTDRDRWRELPLVTKLLGGFRSGTRGAELTDELYAPEDTVLTGRYSFNAFEGTRLDDVLQTLGARTVYFCGFLTDQCVERTVRSAALLGYDAYIVQDCTATFIGALQRRVEERTRCVVGSEIVPD